MKKKTMSFISALITLALSEAAIADVDLNTYIHGGSTTRPLAGTTASAEGVFNKGIDSVAQSSESAALSSFDSWWRFVIDGLIEGKFSSTTPGMRIIVR